MSRIKCFKLQRHVYIIQMYLFSYSMYNSCYTLRSRSTYIEYTCVCTFCTCTQTSLNFIQPENLISLNSINQSVFYMISFWGHCDHMVVGFTTTYATTNVVSSIPIQAIQHYVIKFVSDLLQVCSFLRFPPPIKLTTTI